MQQPLSASQMVPSLKPQTPLRELALLFLKLGATAMGGPAVHIAMMEEEVVTRRHWLTRKEFLDFLGAANLIPGPSSTEMAIHIGRVRAGWRGLLVAGVSFILPAALMVTVLAWAYVRYRSLPQITALLYGVKPVVIVVIAMGAYRLVRSAVKSVGLAVLGVAALVAAALGLDPLLILFGAGLLAAVAQLRSRFRDPKQLSTGLAAGGVGAAAVAGIPFSPARLFLVTLKIGATLFGGGYVLVAFLRADFVARLKWLTEQQLLDAVAVGQVTPGPLFTTATFIGYVLAGLPGAILATVGIFLPAFVLVAVSGPLVPRLRHSTIAGAALDGINVAALVLMVVVSAQLGRTAIIDWPTLGIAVVSALLLFRHRVNSAWLVLAGATVGELMLLLRSSGH
jgi:chromate transporter